LDVEPAAVDEREELPSVVLLRGSAWIFSGRVVARAIALATGILLARLLSPAELGDFYLAFSLATLAAIIARVGMDTPATRLVAEALAQKAPGRARSVLLQTLVFTAAATGLVAAVSILGGWNWLSKHGFDNHRLAGVAIAATALIVCEALQGTLVGWFRGLQVMRLVVLYDELIPGATFLVVLVGVWLVSGQVGVAGALEIRAGGFALAILGAGLALRGRVHMLRGPGRVPRRQVAELGLTMTGTMLISAAVGATSDILILGIFRPAQDVAAYGIAVSVASLLSMPYLALATALGPQLAQLSARGERDRMEDIVRGTTGIVGIATVAATIPLVVLAQPILTTLFGAEYAGAANILIVLALAQAVFVLTGPCGLVLTMTGHHRPAFLLTAVAAVASIGADVWAAPRYGALGVAVASSSAIALDNVLTVVFARRLVGVWTLPRFRVKDFRLAAEVTRRAVGTGRGPGPEQGVVL
jgi:O-antigen/teichoic acid export membrane protein